MSRTIAYLHFEVRDLEELSEKWGSIMAFGVLLAVTGAFAVASAATATLVSVVWLGAVVLGGGILQVVQAFSAPRWSGFFLRALLGILYAVVGMLLMSRPGIGAASLTWLLAVLFFTGGATRIVFSLVARFPQWGWTCFGGAVSMLLGVMIVNGWPGSALWLIGTLVGVDLIFDGWSLVSVALAARAAKVA